MAHVRTSTYQYGTSTLVQNPRLYQCTRGHVRNGGLEAGVASPTIMPTCARTLRNLSIAAPRQRLFGQLFGRLFGRTRYPHRYSAYRDSSNPYETRGFVHTCIVHTYPNTHRDSEQCHARGERARGRVNTEHTDERLRVQRCVVNTLTTPCVTHVVHPGWNGGIPGQCGLEYYYDSGVCVAVGTAPNFHPFTPCRAHVLSTQ